MPEFEYKVVPAPTKGVKAKGVKTAEGRFANALELLMNEMAADGWEYLRADMLPSEERQGLTGSTTNWRNVLVFRRPRTGALDEFQPQIIPAAVHTEDAPEPDEAEAEDVLTLRPDDSGRREPPVRTEDTEVAPEAAPQTDADDDLPVDDESQKDR